MRYTNIFIFGFSLFLIAGCSGAKEQLGLTNTPPDEFAVVKRAPLTLPPDYSLRPPRPGAPRPQESEPSIQARQTVFGEGNQAQERGPSTPESALLQQVGAENADPSIREKVDSETSADLEDNRPVAQKLLGLMSDQEPSAQVIVPGEEAERIQTNKQEGRPLTEGETPTVTE